MAIPDKNWQPPYVSIETTMGEFVVELYWKHAPMTCRNFAELARRGYYNETKFHRIIRDFMIQGGDPTGTAGAAIFLMSQVIGLCQMMGLDKKAVAAAKYAAAKAADQEYLTKAKDKFWAGTREAMTGANAMFGTISVDAFDIAQRADMESAVAELGFVERSPDVSYEETVGTLGPMYGRHSKNSVIQDAWSIKFNAGEATEIAVADTYKARYEATAKEMAVGDSREDAKDDMKESNIMMEAEEEDEMDDANIVEEKVSTDSMPSYPNLLTSIFSFIGVALIVQGSVELWFSTKSNGAEVPLISKA